MSSRHPRHPSPRWLLIGAVALALGCAARSAGPSGAPSPAAAEIIDPPQPGDPVVTLLDTGAEPRAPLRYRIPAGDKTTLVMEMGIEMHTSIDGHMFPLPKMPPFRMTMVNEVRDVAPSGTTRNVSTLSAMDVLARPGDNADIVDKMKARYATLVGMTTDMKITSRGFARDVTINAPPGARQHTEELQTMRNATQQASAIFPAEPVGQGSRWRIDKVIDSGMFRVNQSTIVTLDRRDANRVLLSVAVEQTAPAQPFNSDHPTSLERLVGKGEGQMDVGLATRTLSGRLASKAHVETTFFMNEKHARSNTDVDMNLAFLPVPAPGPARAAGD